MHAIILAGGRGERLRPFTEDRPKPMVEVLGVPILA
ncbi:MAG: nucleotidyltransferase family protein, partial [Armatimonadota bacterium]